MSHLDGHAGRASTVRSWLAAIRDVAIIAVCALLAAGLLVEAAAPRREAPALRAIHVRMA